MGTVERLIRRVGGIGNVTARGMPVRIDTQSERLLGLGVVGGNCTVGLPKWETLIDESFLPDKMKADYHLLLSKRIEVLNQ